MPRIAPTLLLLLMLNACAHTNGLVADTPANASATTVKWVNITPFSAVRWGCDDTKASASARGYPGFYSRLHIVGLSIPSSADRGQKVEILSYNPRYWLERLVWGQHHAVSLSANVAVGEFKATVPLVTIDHVSNRNDGETFSRIVYHQAQQFPLVLMKATGGTDVVSVKVQVRASDVYESSAAGTTLQLVQQALNIVSPQSAVLTALTAQSSKDMASAVDTTVSKLFGTSIDEEQWVDQSIRAWGKGVDIDFRIPPAEGGWDETAYEGIGKWRVSWDQARPSVFSPVRLDEAAVSLDPSADGCSDDPQARETNARKAQANAKKDALTRPAEVLTFPLSNAARSSGTVEAYLKQQSWWSASMQAFAAAGATPKPDDIAKFCRAIRTAMTDVGLNALDAEIVALSVKAAGDIPSAVVTKMGENSADCGGGT